MQSNPMLVSQLLTLRANSVGPRVEKLLEKGSISPRGVGYKHACFSLVFAEDNKASEITHCSGAKLFLHHMPHVVITRAFELHDNHLDITARVSLHPTVLHLWELFPVDATFVELVVKDRKSRVLADLAKGLQIREAERTQAVLDATVNPSMLDETVKERRQKSTEKARAAMEAKKAQRGAKRKISLVAM